MLPIRAPAGRPPRARAAGQAADRVAGWRSPHVLLQLQQVVVELIEAALPHSALLRDPALRRPQRLRYKPISAYPPHLSRADEPAPFENVEMLRERRERNVERPRQLARTGKRPVLMPARGGQAADPR